MRGGRPNMESLLAATLLSPLNDDSSGADEEKDHNGFSSPILIKFPSLFHWLHILSKIN